MKPCVRNPSVCKYLKGTSPHKDKSGEQKRRVSIRKRRPQKVTCVFPLYVSACARGRHQKAQQLGSLSPRFSLCVPLFFCLLAANNLLNAGPTRPVSAILPPLAAHATLQPPASLALSLSSADSRSFALLTYSQLLLPTLFRRPDFAIILFNNPIWLLGLVFPFHVPFFFFLPHPRKILLDRR